MKMYVVAPPAVGAQSEKEDRLLQYRSFRTQGSGGSTVPLDGEGGCPVEVTLLVETGVIGVKEKGK